MSAWFLMGLAVLVFAKSMMVARGVNRLAEAQRERAALISKISADLAVLRGSHLRNISSCVQRLRPGGAMFVDDMRLRVRDLQQICTTMDTLVRAFDGFDDPSQHPERPAVVMP